MFKHEKALLHEVKVNAPNPNYAAMLQEQIGGSNGELKAGLQYISQSFQTIDFLLNREEAHNALFREALGRVQSTGSNRDFGVDEDARLYFDLSTPGRYFQDPRPTAPGFQNPRQPQPSP